MGTPERGDQHPAEKASWTWGQVQSLCHARVRSISAVAHAAGRLLPFFQRLGTNCRHQAMVSITPPSTRNAAPLVADARGEATYTTILATSSGVAARAMMELGRCVRTNSLATASTLLPCWLAASVSIVTTPSDKVGPGSTEFTVTLLPRVSFASPRAIDSCAVLVKP